MRRVAITGTGALSAAGIGTEALWAAARDGRSGVATIEAPGFERARIRVAAQVPDFDPADHFDRNLLVTLDRFSALALHATAQALEQAGLRDEPLGSGTAVIIGTGAGGATTTEAGARAFYLGKDRPDPMTVPKTMPNAAASQISMRHGALGPTFALSSACASSAQAIGIGFQMVRSGMVGRAIVGGSESMITPAVMRAWELLRVMTPDTCRPFSKGRNGMVLGEGAGMLVIEPLDTAVARGASVLGEIGGYGTTADAADLLRPDPQGAARAMQLALADAGLAPADIAYINAHGTGTVYNDIAETDALNTVFGTHLRQVAVSSTKPVHGHTIGAAGALETLVTLKSLEQQTAPPTINWSATDAKCLPDPVPNTARPISGTAAMTNSFAFGGINACLILKRPN